MDNSTVRLVAGLYIALTSTMTHEGVKLANEIMDGLANDPGNSESERAAFRLICECNSVDP